MCNSVQLQNSLKGGYFFITKYDPFHAAAHLDVCAGLPTGIWNNIG